MKGAVKTMDPIPFGEGREALCISDAFMPLLKDNVQFSETDPVQTPSENMPFLP
jgi:hypothetical protein